MRVLVLLAFPEQNGTYTLTNMPEEPCIDSPKAQTFRVWAAAPYPLKLVPSKELHSKPQSPDTPRAVHKPWKLWVLLFVTKSNCKLTPRSLLKPLFWHLPPPTPSRWECCTKGHVRGRAGCSGPKGLCFYNRQCQLGGSTTKLQTCLLGRKGGWHICGHALCKHNIVCAVHICLPTHTQHTHVHIYIYIHVCIRIGIYALYIDVTIDFPGDS